MQPYGSLPEGICLIESAKFHKNAFCHKEEIQPPKQFMFTKTLVVLVSMSQ